MLRRRRRRSREIPFSLDSFLDVVANVVGLIVRLILVAWFGARGYKALLDLPAPPPDLAHPPVKDLYAPLQQELAKHRQELQLTQDRLLEQLRRLKELRADNEQTDRQLALLGEQRVE